MHQMHRVAEYLSIEAKRAKDDYADAFARSAFNRYYYASYLSVRGLLAMLDSAWKTTSHAAIPDLLESTLMKRVRRQARKLSDLGLLSIKERRNLEKQAQIASAEMATVLRGAYGVRVVADYKPEQRVVFGGSEFSLANYTRHEALNWNARVDKSKSVILRVAKELGIAN